MKKILPLALLLSLGSLSFVDRRSVPFGYRYEVVAASNSLNDLYELYDYKEHLIDVYDRTVLTLDSRHRQQFLSDHIAVFNYKEGVTSYVNGVIVQTIGPGLGQHLRGDLKKDACDTETIREKFFIFDLFS